jgi:hypothetical protein
MHLTKYSVNYPNVTTENLEAFSLLLLCVSASNDGRTPAWSLALDKGLSTNGRTYPGIFISLFS